MADKPAKAPAYQWYPKDAETDEAYRLMTCEELGVYERLRDCQWLEGSLPAELEKLTILVGHRMTLRRLEFIWPKIAPCFPDDGTGRLVNPKLEEQRAQLAAYIATKKIAGRAGGLAKAKQTSSTPTPAARVSLVANPTSSSATASATASAEQTPSVNARSKRPIFKGQRLVVFDWMLEDLTRMLGTFADSFGFDEWFYRLDSETLKADVIVPQRDGGKWLYDRTLEEAVRRGLPIVIAQTKQDLRRSSQSAQLEAWARS
jgi:hypothetical protein